MSKLTKFRVGDWVSIKEEDLYILPERLVMRINQKEVENKFRIVKGGDRRYSPILELPMYGWTDPSIGDKTYWYVRESAYIPYKEKLYLIGGEE